MNSSNTEKAVWLDWRRFDDSAIPDARIYFGHETCPRRLPPPGEARRIARSLASSGRKVTLVTPLLPEPLFMDAVRLIETVSAETDRLEVVCSDWGLLFFLARRELAVPVIGRLLASQHTDPRIPRILRENTDREDRSALHLDGTISRVVKREAPPALARHFRSTWIAKPSAGKLFRSMGITRYEISNVAQGVEIETEMSCSLHLSDVPVTVMRWCPGRGEDFTSRNDCSEGGCREDEIRWKVPSIEMEVYRKDNALYYRGSGLQGDLCGLQVDRVVRRLTGTGSEDEQV